MDEGISVESNQDHVIVDLQMKILINVKEIYVISFLDDHYPTNTHSVNFCGNACL